MHTRNSESLLSDVAQGNVQDVGPPAVRVVMALDEATKELGMHFTRETLSNDATQQADALNDLSHLKLLQYCNLKSDFSCSA